MGENLVLIPEVKQGMEHWAAKITITEEMPTLIGHMRGTRYKRYIFTDVEGNTIPAVVYGTTIEVFSRALHLHGVYSISNANVQAQTGAHKMQGYPVHWVLHRKTLIRAHRDEQLNLWYFLDGLTPINIISQAMGDEGAIIDVMAVVIKSEDSKAVPTKYGEGIVQNFTIVDTRPMSLSIWDQQVEHYGPVLVSAAANYLVVVAKRLRVRNFRGPALGSTNTTSFAVYLPIQGVTALKAWFDSVREMELPNLITGYSIAAYKNLVDQNLVRKYSVGEIQASDKCDDFWTRAFLQLTDEDQRFFYIGCSQCSTDVSSLVGVEYHCLFCRTDVVASIRPKVSIDVFDHSGRITVGAIKSVAEEILECTATQLGRIAEKGTKLDISSFQSRFHDKMYLVLLRRSYGRDSNEPRHLLLVAYLDDTVYPEKESATNNPALAGTSTGPSNVSTSSESSPGGALQVSPLKRQLENVTIKTGTPANKALFINISANDAATPDDLTLSLTEESTNPSDKLLESSPL